MLILFFDILENGIEADGLLTFKKDWKPILQCIINLWIKIVQVSIDYKAIYWFLLDFRVVFVEVEDIGSCPNLNVIYESSGFFVWVIIEPLEGSHGVESYYSTKRVANKSQWPILGKAWFCEEHGQKSTCNSGLVDCEDELPFGGVHKVDQIREDFVATLLLLDLRNLSKRALTQKSGRSTSIPGNCENLCMFEVSYEVLPVLRFVLVLLEEACDADDYVLTFDLRWRNPL